MLHQGAQQVLKEHQGFLPTSAKDLLDISGIGRYTAGNDLSLILSIPRFSRSFFLSHLIFLGAISSIAFNQATPLVDGNVIRVLSRLRAIGGNMKASNTVQLFWYDEGHEEVKRGRVIYYSSQKVSSWRSSRPK